jgi:nucleotide-binding universal stress UspA family protein
MRVLFPVKGVETPSYFEAAAGSIPASEVTALMVAHVVDEARRAGLEHGRDRFLERRELGPGRRAEIESAEREAAEAVVNRAVAAVMATGRFPDVEPETSILHGKRNEVIWDLTDQWGADLIVVRGRAGKPGPHSVGKTARFLIDHAPKAALLVRDMG